MQKRLNISFNIQPNTTDPLKAADFASSTLSCLIYEGLTRALPKQGVELALAERVEISSDGKLYTFYLKKAFWNNHEQITAFDFETSWKKALTLPSSSAFLFYPIKNVESFLKGKACLEEVGIKALDIYTFQVELETPTPYFYSLTAFPTFFPLPPKPNLYSGPFQIDKMVYNYEILLKKNPLFWNEKEIALDEIHISIIPDEMTALQMFERKELDWIGSYLSPIPLDALGSSLCNVEFLPSAGSTFCSFNTQTFPFSNLHLRKAFSYAIHREEIVSQITKAEQIPAFSILPPSLTSQSISFYDPQKARFHFEKALEELSIEAEELERLILYYRSSPLEKQLAQILQLQWKETLGIEIQLAQSEYKGHIQRLQNRNYQFSVASWIAQFDDPVSILDRFKDRNHLKNYSGWEEAEYTKILQEALTSGLRSELLNQAETLFTNHLPIAPIYHWRFYALYHPKVKTVPPSACGGILFDRFEKNSF